VGLCIELCSTAFGQPFAPSIRVQSCSFELLTVHTVKGTHLIGANAIRSTFKDAELVHCTSCIMHARSESRRGHPKHHMAKVL
jgi:hypothetical protein